MTDIVEKLREKVPSLGFEDHDPTYDDRIEAADEIERLRRGGCARDQTLTQFCAVAHGLALENERLCAALRAIAACDERDDMNVAMQIAREALEDE